VCQLDIMYDIGVDLRFVYEHVIFYLEYLITIYENIRQHS